MRKTLGRLHRWLGLLTAVFLFVAGLTGAIIAWDHELDAWLNPDLYEAATTGGPALPALALARKLEADEPRLRVRYLPLASEPGHTLMVLVEPRIDPATKQPYALGYDQVAVDPRSGRVTGRRDLTTASIGRRTLLPFLYKLHYTLHLPPVGGFPAGKWLMGLIAIVWFVDGFVALYVSFPSLKVWRKSFAFRLRQGAHKLTFDLHRSSGVWAWALLTVLAFTAISMNLGREVVRPVVASVAALSPTPFDRPRPKLIGEPTVTRERVLELARAQAAALGIEAPIGGIAYSGARSLYFAGFFTPGNEHGDWGLGNARLYFDAHTGAPIGTLLPGRGSAGDLFMQAQFPLHSGRILGTAGRAAISVLGLLVALLSATGVLLWARKRRARALRAAATRSTRDVAPLHVQGSSAE